jgi:hypothetical protein
MGGPDTATSTSKTELPAYAQDAQKALIAKGQSLTSNLTGNNPLYGVAGFNPDQLTSFDLTRNMVDDANTNQFANLGQASFNPSGDIALADPNAGGQASAAQINPGEIQQFMNPYLQSALTPTLDNMRTQHNQDMANTNAKLTAGKAYGGSRQAVADALMSKSFDAQVAQTAGQLMAQGYDKATATAMANAQMRQQANLQNASTANNFALQNASMINSSRQQNASQANAMALQNAAQQINAANLNQTQKMQALQLLMAQGDKEQQLQQAGIDAPMKALQSLVTTTPGLNNTGSNTTTTQPLQDNTASTLIGGGLMLTKLLPMLAGLSDENEKTNIQPLGKDPKTGLQISAYDYKSDVEAAKKSGNPMPPKRVGPMAGDIEKLLPSAISKVGGKKIVDFGALQKLIEAA